jgi:hypothetical protein
MESAAIHFMKLLVISLWSRVRASEKAEMTLITKLGVHFTS